MDETPKELKANDKLITNAVDDFAKGTKVFEAQITEAFIKLLAKLEIDENGKILNTANNRKLILRIESIIANASNAKQYNESIKALMPIFEEIGQNTIALQNQLNDLTVSETAIRAASIQTWAIDNTFYQLKGAGFRLDFVTPLKQALAKAVLQGGTIATLESNIPNEVKQRMGGYVRNAITDTMRTYEGVVQQNIATVYELNALLYVGPLKTTSRSQCVRWIEEKNGLLLISELQDEIDWAYANGSGMKDETNISNFAALRGGWGCEHKAIPTRR